MIGIFDTRTMLEALDERRPPRQYLLDTFFSRVEVSQTQYVDIDVRKKGRRMAPFVNPLKEGVVIEREGHSTKSFVPPYIKEKIPTEAGQMLERSMGDHPYETRSPQQRASEKLAEDLSDLQDMIERREEWMAAQSLTTGKVTVVGEGVDAEIDFQMSASHKPVLAAPDQWSETAATPLEDLRAWKDIIAKDSGLIANRAVFGNDALNAFLRHDDVQEALNSRRNIGSSVSFDQLDDGVEFIGVVENLEIVRYSEWYEPDGGGPDQPMVPTDGIILGSTGARTARHYGAIKDLRAGLIPLRWFPKSWEVDDPSVRWLMLQSAPVVVPHQIDGFVYADVL